MSVAFCDSSALVKLIMEEPESGALRQSLETYSRVMARELAALEVPRAIRRRDPGRVPVAHPSSRVGGWSARTISRVIPLHLSLQRRIQGPVWPLPKDVRGDRFLRTASRDVHRPGSAGKLQSFMVNYMHVCSDHDQKRADKGPRCAQVESCSGGPVDADLSLGRTGTDRGFPDQPRVDPSNRRTLGGFGDERLRQ